MNRIKKLCCALLILGLLLPQAILSNGFTSEAASGKWKKDSKGYYYQYANGSRSKKGWKTIGGKKYYFNAKGYRTTGWKTIAKKKYYFNAKGVMVTGLQSINGVKYKFNSSGVFLGLQPKEVFKNNVVYGAPLDKDYGALFLTIKTNGSFSVGTYDDSLGGNELKGKMLHIAKRNSTSYKMKTASISNGNWIKNGTCVYLYNKGTKISSIPTSFFENGKNTSYAFGLNPYAIGKDWKTLKKLPKFAIYFDMAGGGYWFIIKE